MVHAAILIVDNDPGNLSLYNNLLKQDDYEVFGAGCASDAIEVLERNPAIDLILLSMELPDAKGTDLCRRLKTDPQTGHIPVILVSGPAKDNLSMTQGVRAGADGYLTRPIEEAALRAWVKATLRTSRLQARLARRESAAKMSDEDVLKTVSRLAHSINNPLQGLYAAADMLEMRLPEGSKERELVIDVLHQAEHIAETVANASLLARGRLRS